MKTKSDTAQRQAARKFVEYWTFQRGSEKGEDQQFWNSLLRDVLGVADVEQHIKYQMPVQLKDTTKFLDAWIPETRVLIEHKSRGVNLDAPQSGHGGLTPYEQAAEYDNARPFDEKARWIVTCNFDEFRIYDRAKPLAPPLTLKLGNLPKEAYRLAFLINPKEKAIDRELEISVQAGRIVGEIYDALLGQYVGGSQLAATAITMYAYDGATSRILTSTRDAPTLPPRTTSYLYNDWGEQAATVEVESFDVAPGLTNGVAWGRLATGWESNGLVTFTGSSLAFHVDEVVANGALFVKVFRDFNANGVYDADVDAFVSRRLTKADNGKTVTLRIGDSDGDGVPDSVELGEGTGPLDRLAYCFNLSLTYTDVFQTTNALTFTASFGTNRVYGPCVVGERTWTHDFGHLLATDGEKVSVSVWDDANRNGEWDAGETSNRYAIAVTGHDMVVTNALSYLNFDRNGNSLPDWWEVQEGLDAEGVARRAYDDPDGDESILLAFRMEKCEADSCAVKLPFAKEHCVYMLENADTGEKMTVPGRTLKDGITLTLPEKRSCLLYRIKRT